MKFWWNYQTASYDILEETPNTDDEALKYLPQSDLVRSLYLKLRLQNKSVREAMYINFLMF